ARQLLRRGRADLRRDGPRRADPLRGRVRQRRHRADGRRRSHDARDEGRRRRRDTPRAHVNRAALGRRFARLVTTLVVREPRLWRLFRSTFRRQFESLAPTWETIVSPGHLAPYEAALDRI